MLGLHGCEDLKSVAHFHFLEEEVQSLFVLHSEEFFWGAFKISRFPITNKHIIFYIISYILYNIQQFRSNTTPLR